MVKEEGGQLQKPPRAEESPFPLEARSFCGLGAQVAGMFAIVAEQGCRGGGSLPWTCGTQMPLSLPGTAGSARHASFITSRVCGEETPTCVSWKQHLFSSYIASFVS